MLFCIKGVDLPVIPRIEDIEWKSKSEKHETISKIRYRYSIYEVCEAWGISMGTYYNLLRRWGIDLSDVRRRRRKLQKGSKIPDDLPRDNVALSRLSVLLQEELDGESLLHFLQAISDRITTASGPFNVKMIIELPHHEGVRGDAGLLPLEIFKGLAMEEKIRHLAKWVKNGHHKDALLRSWGIDVVRFYEMLGEMKIPMVRVLEEKQQLLLEAAKLPSQRLIEGNGVNTPGMAKVRLYEFSGGCTRTLLERDLAFLSRIIKQCTYFKYRVEIRVEEVEGGH